MPHATLTNALTRRINARATRLERIIVEHGILADLLTIAAAVALALLAMLL